MNSSKEGISMGGMLKFNNAASNMGIIEATYLIESRRLLEAETAILEITSLELPSPSITVEGLSHRGLERCTACPSV
jgi:hypothetical protein